MRKWKRFEIYIGIFLGIFLFTVAFFAAFPFTGDALAAEEPQVVSVTYLSDGETVTVPDGGWARNDCTVRVATDAESVLFEYRNLNGQLLSEKTVACIDGIATTEVTTEGTTRLMILPVYADGRTAAATEKVIKLDKTAPRSPEWEESEWNTPEYDTYHLSFTLHSDTVSGIDYRRSVYWFTGTDGTNVVPETTIPDDRPGQPRRVTGLCGNGTLHIKLYDNAGNFAEYSREFTESRIPAVKPKITFSVTEGYRQSVTATVEWQGYDIDVCNCYYEMVYGSNSGGRRRYTAPLTIEREGEVTVRAYYFSEGEETYVEASTSAVDRSGPSSGAMQESFRLNVDLMSESAVWISVRVYDALSGVKSVKFDTGEPFELYDRNMYRITVTDRNIFRIVTEDNVGNVTNFIYTNPNFDYESAWEYAEIFQGLNADDYSAAGWDAVQSAFRSLGFYFNEVNPQSSIMAERKRAVATAIAGKLSVNVRVTEPLNGFGGFTFDIPAASLQLPKGDSVNVWLAGGKGIPANVLTDCRKKSEVNDGAAYSVSVRIFDGAGQRVHIDGKYTFTFHMSQPVGKAVVYYYDGQTAVPVPAVTENGAVTVTAETEGNFIVVAAVGSAQDDLPAGFYIGNSYYQWKWIGVAVGVIAGVCLITFFGVYFLLKRFRTDGAKRNTRIAPRRKK